MDEEKSEVEVSKERQLEILEAIIARDLFEMNLVIDHELVNNLKSNLGERSSSLLMCEEESLPLYKKVLLKKMTSLLS